MFNYQPYYEPNQKELADQAMFDCAKYSLTTILGLITTIFTAIKGRWLLSFGAYILMFISFNISQFFWKRACALDPERFKR